MIASTFGKISSIELNLATRTLKRTTGRAFKVWNYVKPCNIPVTRKSESSRMVKGKGNVKYLVRLLRAGDVLFGLKSLKSRNDTTNVRTA